MCVCEGVLAYRPVWGYGVSGGTLAYLDGLGLLDHGLALIVVGGDENVRAVEG